MKSRIEREWEQSRPPASEGRKLDVGKLQFHLVPWAELGEVVRVLEYGAKKYAPGNWRKVENGKERYLNAAFRHLAAFADGEALDPESGLHHVAHAACCVLFLLKFR